MPDLSKSLKAEHWPEVIDGVLFWQFWQRVSVHTSKKYSPFFYCTIDTPFCQSIYDITLQIMKKLRILQTLIPLNLFFIQRYQLQHLPTIRLAATSKPLKQSKKGTIKKVKVISRLIMYQYRYWCKQIKTCPSRQWQEFWSFLWEFVVFKCQSKNIVNS